MSARLNILLIMILLLILSCKKEDNQINPPADSFATVTMCSKTWAKINLDVDRYQNGDAIPEVKDPEKWSTQTTGAWCYYNNDPALGAIYGKLYNWYAINDPRGLAPKGWHVINESEWKLLEMCMGMTAGEIDEMGPRGHEEGGKLKESGTDHWQSPNLGASNESGFSALPSGRRDENGNFLEINNSVFWWSYPYGNTTGELGRSLSYNSTRITRDHFNKMNGFSVRVIKDY